MQVSPVARPLPLLAPHSSISMKGGLSTDHHEIEMRGFKSVRMNLFYVSFIKKNAPTL